MSTEKAPNPLPPGDAEHDPQGERAHNIAQLLANHPREWSRGEQEWVIDMCASDTANNRAEIRERLHEHGITSRRK